MSIKVSELPELPTPILSTDTVMVVRGLVSYKATGANIPFAGQPKVYKALLTQSGTDAPVVTILVNTLSGTPIWSRIGIATYNLILSGEFISGKTIAIPGGQGYDTGSADPIFSVYRIDDNTIEVSATGDNYLNGAPIIIEVYP